MPVTIGFLRDTAFRAVNIYWATSLTTATIGILVLLFWFVWTRVTGNTNMGKVDDMAKRFQDAYANSRVDINGTVFSLDYELHCAESASREFFMTRIPESVEKTNHLLNPEEISAIDQQCGELRT